MQIAQAEGAIDKKLREKLEKKGVRFLPAMTAAELKALHSPAARTEEDAPTGEAESGNSPEVPADSESTQSGLATELAIANSVECTLEELKALPKENALKPCEQVVQSLSIEGVLDDEEEPVDAAA